MAYLVKTLAISGARSNGAAVAGGKAWFFKPKTQTLIPIFSDADGVLPLSQPVTLNSDGKAVVFIKEQCRLKVEDASSPAATVFDQEEACSDLVALVDMLGISGWTDGTLASALGSIFASVGGTDAKLQESSGLAARLMKSVIYERCISIADAGASTAATDNSTAIQNAINRLNALGGGVLLVPAGIWSYATALSVPQGGKVSVVGVGRDASILRYTGTGSGLSYNGSNGITLSAFTLSHATSTTGDGITLRECGQFVVADVLVTGHRRGFALSGADNGLLLGCQVLHEASGSGVGFLLGDADGQWSNICLVRCDAQSSNGTDNGFGVQVTGAGDSLCVLGGSWTAVNVGIEIDAAFTGRGVFLFGNRFGSAGTAHIRNAPAAGTRSELVELASTRIGGGSIVFSDTSANSIWASFGSAPRPLGIYQGQSQTISGVATFTPNLDRGTDFYVTADNAASNVTIALPTSSYTARDGHMITVIVQKTAAIAGLALNASYRNYTGVVPSTTNATTTVFYIKRVGGNWWCLAIVQGAT